MLHVEQLRGRLEIRCCCNPERLYGTLPVYGEPRIGQRFRFAIPPTFVRDRHGRDVGTVVPGGEVLLEVATVTLGAFCSLERAMAPPNFEEVHRERHDALKYHGDELSFVEKLTRLRHVPGFEPSAESRAFLPDPWEPA